MDQTLAEMSFIVIVGSKSFLHMFIIDLIFMIIILYKRSDFRKKLSSIKWGVNKRAREIFHISPDPQRP